MVTAGCKKQKKKQNIMANFVMATSIFICSLWLAQTQLVNQKKEFSRVIYIK